MKEVWEGRKAVPHIQSQRGHGAAMFDGGAWSEPAGSGRAGTRGQEAAERLLPERWDKEHLGTDPCSEEGDGKGVLNEEVKNKWQRVIWIVKHCRILL